MAKNNGTRPTIAVKVCSCAAPKAPEAPELEPETVDFAAEIQAAIQKAGKPVFTKKLRALTDEYLQVVLQVQNGFALRRCKLESEYVSAVNKNAKEFAEKVAVLKKAYGIR